MKSLREFMARSDHTKWYLRNGRGGETARTGMDMSDYYFDQTLDIALSGPGHPQVMAALMRERDPDEPHPIGFKIEEQISKQSG